MLFAPHFLFKKDINQAETQYDENGNPVFQDSVNWLDMGSCRCDKESTTEVTSSNGKAFRPSFHIVCPNFLPISEGDYIKCLKEGVVKAEGVVQKAKDTNFLGYFELWL